jgi:hypothetical protein
MTERTYRIFLGAALLVILYLSAIYERNDLIYAYIGVLFFEGITNWRIPTIASALQNKILVNPATLIHNHSENNSAPIFFSFEAERVLRLVMALLLVLPFILSIEFLWVLPWFIACMLLLEGVTDICPMLMFFRWLGFK